jgi:DNA-binding NarL/FixJ family response regulator
MMAASNTWIRSTLPQGGVNNGKRKVRRVLIVDDHPIVRQGLRRIMENEEDLTVCGEAETARDARTAIKELLPDVVIADLSLKQGDGIELVRDVRAHYPQLPILVLSMHDETIYAERMLIDRLSNRELQILHMIGKGMSTRETAHSLNLSIKTVESHRQRIKRKLNLTTGTQLVQYAVNWFTGREAGSTAHGSGDAAMPVVGTTEES